MILEVKNGSFSYDNKDADLLDNINFSVEKGDLLAILGPNGAGKTTLLRCIMGFLKWKGGASLLNGRDICGIPSRELWRNIAYVPQAKNVVSAYTVEEMVLLGRASHFNIFAKPSATDLKIVKGIMNEMGIKRLSAKKCNEISGGELQMVLIARALAAEPEILILDEPESNLDFKNQLIILETMSEMAAEGMTCIFNTHYPAHALQRANKALLLCKSGRYLFGSAGEVITEKNIQSAFGVKAVISQVETAGRVMQDVLPVEVVGNVFAENDLHYSAAANEKVLAVLSIVAHHAAAAEPINDLLHQYGKYIIGRMGMPYKDIGVFIISVTVDAPVKIVEEMTVKLSALRNINVKATYAEQEAEV
ncbi:MAG: TM1266 family iron-only hydrogenase system putative regulator [Bacillota bacterium]|jgi:iron complex transport system ATP-binding protein